MASSDPEDLLKLAKGRIFPRNLTARAGEQVAGNPVQSRPESGVDNTHPGLEFDPRNLDRIFFQGLTFDFQFRLGARVADLGEWKERITEQLAPGVQPPEAADLFLWGLHGCLGSAPQKRVYLPLLPVDGYGVLRKVRELEPGELAVVIGTGNGSEALRLQAQKACESAGPPCVVFTDQGQLAYAVLRGTRARYIVEDDAAGDAGVIEPELLLPGTLTQSLCSPWQWDFADCGCYYWAASRPDIVTGQDGADGLNYQRDRSRPATNPPPSATTWNEWTEGQMTQVAMMTRWEELPLVVGGRERDSGDVMYVAHAGQQAGAVASTPSTSPSPTAASIIERLTHLATVEHALCVQYLYASYSVRVSDAGPDQQRLQAAAKDLRDLALAEMRHMRKVNEALWLIGGPSSLKRATHYAVPGPSGAQGPGQAFALLSLTDEAIDIFIGLERPAGVVDNLGSSYASLLADVRALAIGAGRERLERILEDLIKDGEAHALTLEGIKRGLSDIALEQRLRVPPAGPPGVRLDAGIEAQLDEADGLYGRLLAALGRAYGGEPAERGRRLVESRDLMRELEAIGQRLAERGIGVRFREPSA